MKRNNLYRLLALALVMLALALLAALTPLGHYLSFEMLRTNIQQAGAWGMALFIAAFVLGTLMNVPGFVFIILAFLLFGYGPGYLVAYIGAILAVMVHFAVIRAIGGKPLAAIEKPFIKKLMDKFDRHPVRTVIILRLIFFIAPPVNYLLALSQVRVWHFALGTLIGNLVPIAVQGSLLYFARDYVLARLA